MPGLLSISTSALTAVDQWLSTTGHNIANVNTPGYSRQTVALSANAPTLIGGQYVGTGVTVDSVQRDYSSFLTTNLWNTTSQQSQTQSLSDMSAQVDNLLGDTSAGLSPAIDTFFKATQGVANDPTDTAARQEMLSTGETLTKTFNTQSARLDTLAQQVNKQMNTQVSQINNLTSSIAKYNNEITSATANTGNRGSANDLKDSRDEAIRQLSAIIGVSVFQQSDGTLNVSVGNGQNIVSGNQVRYLAVTENPYDLSQNEIALGTSVDATQSAPDDQSSTLTPTARSTADIISSQVTGGSLGGLLQFRNTVLQPTQNGLWRVAVGLASALNQQQQQGMDLKGKLGTPLFTVGTPQVFPSLHNTNNLQVNAEITDASALGTSDYRLDVASGGYILTRLSDGTTTNLSIQAGGSSSSAITLTPPVDGITFSLQAGTGAQHNTGDSFLIRPTQTGASQISMAINDPSAVAAASPIRTNATTGNTGTATLSVTQVVDTTNPAFASTGKLIPPILVRFDNPPAVTGQLTYSVYDNTNPNNPIPLTDNRNPNNPLLLQHVVYDPAQDAAIFPQENVDYGYRVTLSGTPNPGDSFTVDYNSGGTGDNSNILALGNLQHATLLAGKTATFQDAYGRMVAGVGTTTQRAQTDNTASKNLLTQAKAAQQSLSGVNLDEEAANLLKYQQAYQAAAQLVSTANTLFGTILGVVGR